MIKKTINDFKTLFDPHKFSFSEIFANNNGKTSSTKIIGFLVSIVCLFIFIMLVVYYFFNPGECANVLEIIDRTVSYFSISAGLMGIKSVTSSFGKQKIEIVDNRDRLSYSSMIQQIGNDIAIVCDSEAVGFI